jgi:arsenate reductase
MKKVYHLSTCSTCKRIIDNLQLKSKNFDFQDVKTNKITREQLEQMHEMAGSYEALFSRRSMQFKARNLGKEQLTESDYKMLILDEYTFLKRPVVLLNDQIFIGNAKKNLEQLENAQL